jgi:WD40 repeat protein
MKKKIALLTALFLVALVGCGDSKPGEQSQNQPSAETEEEAAELAAKQATEEKLAAERAAAIAAAEKAAAEMAMREKTAMEKAAMEKAATEKAAVEKVAGESVVTLGSLHGSSVIESVVFSRDGKRIVSGHRNGMIRVFDLDTGRTIHELKGHLLPNRLVSNNFQVNSLIFSPDGKRIVSASNDDTIKVWDAETGREIRTLRGHKHVPQPGMPLPVILEGDVWAVAFSPDGKRIVSGSNDDTIKVWDAETGRVLRTLRGNFEEEPGLLNMKPDLVFRNFLDGVHSVAFSPDGKRIISGSSDNMIRVWDAETGREIRTLQTRHHSRIAMSPNGTLIASVSADRYIRMWNAQTGQEMFERKQLSVTRVVFSPDGKRIATGGWGDDVVPCVKIWDAQTGEEMLALEPGERTSINSVAFSPDGKRIGVGWDSFIKIWDISSLKP